jgi:hypothetical protein
MSAPPASTEKKETQKKESSTSFFPEINHS